MKLNLRIDKLHAPNGHALPFPCRFVLSSDAFRAESIAIDSLDVVLGKTLTLMLPDRETVGGELSVVTAPSNTILKSLFGGTESVRFASGFWLVDCSQLPSQTTILFAGDDEISSSSNSRTNTQKEILLEMTATFSVSAQRKLSDNTSSSSESMPRSASQAALLPPPASPLKGSSTSLSSSTTSAVSLSSSSSTSVVKPNDDASPPAVPTTVFCQSFYGHGSIEKAVKASLQFMNQLNNNKTYTIISVTESIDCVRVWYRNVAMNK